MKKRPYKKLYALSPEQYVEYALCDLKKAGNKTGYFIKTIKCNRKKLIF